MNSPKGSKEVKDWVLMYFCAQGMHKVCGQRVGTRIECDCWCHRDVPLVANYNVP